MDEATRLIAELQQKLAELDTRVAAYRHGMAAEFTRYSDQLLRNVPDHVARRVSQAVAESLSNYPSLNPGPAPTPPPPPPPDPGGDGTSPSPTPRAETAASATDAADASPAPSSFSTWRSRIVSPPPILPHTSGVPAEPVRSPHEREKEFHGLFTPTYLPLLDHADRSLHSPPTSPPAPLASPPPPPGLGRSDQGLPSPATTETSSSELTPNPTPLRPSPVHRITDGTTSSVDSAGSDGSSRVRKSALRRRGSSSASRPPESPRDPSRRVRFSFQGEEVLPTSSPEATTSPLYGLGGAEEDASIADEGESYLGPSLADIEDEEPPVPRKVSSSQALRALSRNPLEEGTTWTVVNPDPDPDPELELGPELGPEPEPVPETEPEDPADSGLEPGFDDDLETPLGLQDTSAPFTPDTMPPKVPPQRYRSERHARGDAPGSPVEDLEAQNEDADDSDNDSLFMRRRSRREPPSPAARSPITSPRPQAASAATSARGPSSHAAAPARRDDSDEAMFDLDADDQDEGLRRAVSAQASAEKHIPEDPEDRAEPETRGREREPARPTHTYGASPAIPIRRPPPAGSPPARAAERPGSFTVGSIGSIRGRPIRADVVKDPKVLEAAEAMGDVRSFVGSVNGRSGFDQSDANSYRASLRDPHYTGTPLSLSNRLAREQAARRGDASDGEDERD